MKIKTKALLLHETVNHTNTTIEEIKEEKNIIEFKKNSEIIADMQAIMFALVPIDWLMSGSQIVIDADIFDESKDYLLFEDINATTLQNAKSGDIKIYAVDEYLNNKFVRTRCYVDYE